MGNPRHREEDCVGETRQAIETPTEAGEETITDAINVTLENHWHQAPSLLFLLPLPSPLALKLFSHLCPSPLLYYG